METTNIVREIISLPPEAQKEMLDFMAFLKTRYPPVSPPKKVRRTKLTNEPFIGMWRSRQDMQDSTAVDTDILIDAARQVREAVRCLADMEQRSALAISAITQMELLAGCRNKTELRHTERFLQRFPLETETQVIAKIIEGSGKFMVS